MNIKQAADGIRLSQESYIKPLHEVEISQKKSQKKNMNLNEEEVHQYRLVVGQLNWIGPHTRSDIL